jgi:hypothetical protein
MSTAKKRNQSRILFVLLNLELVVVGVITYVLLCSDEDIIEKI